MPRIKKSKTTPAKVETPAKAETPAVETPAVVIEKPMSGEAEAISPDHLAISTEELPLKDEVIISKEELPADHVDFNKEASPYDEDVETIEAEDPSPEKADNEEWVNDPTLLRKTKGYRDTLNGTLYRGVRK